MFQKLRSFFWKKPPSEQEPLCPDTASSAEPEVPEVSQATWRILGHSVRGKQHVTKNLPNQDAIEWWDRETESLPRVLAVADGHGSAKSFRSDVGSRLAVEMAIAAARELLQSAADNPSAFRQTWETEFPLELVKHWKHAVRQHVTEHPFSVEEVEHVASEQGAKARQQVEQTAELAYGSTVLLVVIAESFVACLQLGDGNIVILDADGEVSQPMGEDARLIANETTSLCGPTAWQDVRTHFQTLAGKPPALILAATDGYANAFRTSAGFLAVAQDLLEILVTDGYAAVQDSLPGWLDEASRDGSGDDITLGILWRTDAKPVAKPSSPESRTDGANSDQTLTHQTE